MNKNSYDKEHQDAIVAIMQRGMPEGVVPALSVLEHGARCRVNLTFPRSGSKEGAMGWASFIFDAGHTETEIESIRLDDKHIAPVLLINTLKNLATVLEFDGIRNVKVEAGQKDGSALWARLGFLPEPT